MRTAIERVLEIRVADVMSRDAITISANATMGEAAEVLCGQNISGAPVVDEMGHCVGVLSATDFAERDQDHRSSIHHGGRDDDHAIIQSTPNAAMHIEWEREDSVRRFMHETVQTVDDKTPLIDAARIMCSEHIHRLVVLDETSHPAGVVSSLDLLKGLVQELKS